MYLRRVSEQERGKYADSLVNLAIAAGSLQALLGKILIKEAILAIEFLAHVTEAA
jgi:hypothetical protein